MNTEELREAFLKGSPVVYTDRFGDKMHYLCVSAIIYRKNKKGSVVVSAELRDESTGVIIVLPERLSLDS